MSAAPIIPEPLVTIVENTDPPAEPAPTIELRGRHFPVADGVSLVSLMKFATIAKRGVSTDDLEGLVALYDLLRSCIADDAWDAFEAHAAAVRAQGEELIEVVGAAIKAAAGRPTQPPSRSPGGHSTTGPSSAVGSSSPGSPVRQGDVRVQQRLEEQGRPDLGLVVKRAREASTTSSAG